MPKNHARKHIKHLQCILILLGVLLGPVEGALSAAAPDRNWLSLSSEKILIPTGESDYLQQDKTYPRFFSWLFEDMFPWKPEEYGDLKSSCPSAFRELRSLRRMNEEELQEIFSSCQKSDSWSTLIGFAKILAVDFKRVNNPFFHPVVISLPEGQKIKGLLGLHSFTQNRPLVILRLGVFGNALQFMGEKYLPIQLFEQGPFNILIVESTSGSDYLTMNKNRWGMAGVDEGLQNYFIARQLSDASEPLSKLVSSIHFVGMSLGGQGLLTMSEILRSTPVPKVKNFLALCPVVNLDDSLHGLVAKPVKGFLTDLWMQKRLGKFMEARFGGAYEGRTWSGIFHLRPEVTLDLIRLIGDHYDAPNFSEWNVNGSALSAKKSLDIRADKLRLAPQIPFTVLAAKDDPIVLYDRNSRFLRRLQDKFPQLKVLTLENGHHCAYPVVYDWSLTGELIKKLVQGNTSINVRFHETALVAATTGAAQRVEVRNIDFDEDTKQWRVTLISIPSEREVVFQMSRDDLDFDFPHEDLTEQEKVVGKRWLWQNIETLQDAETGLWRIRWPAYQF